VVLTIRVPDGPNLSWRSLVLEAPRCDCREPGCVLSQVIRRSISYGVLGSPIVCHWREFDRGGVPDLSVSGDNFELVEDNPHDLTTTSEPEAPMQSLNQLPVVTNLVDARSA
jgi:hypothetical protein